VNPEKAQSMQATPVPPAEPSKPQSLRPAVAPAWHTAGVFLLLAGMVALGLHARTRIPMDQGHNRVLGYLITTAIEWIMLAFIALGPRWGGASLRTLAGGFAPTWRSVLRDLGIAIAYLLVSQIVLGAISAAVGYFIHSNPEAVLKKLLPQTSLEIAVYLALALTAGICEETIFRGYLQYQFTAWTGSTALAITLQGIVFGASHAYQGPAMMIVIAVYGSMFGLLTWWRKSLRPGMMAHFLQDAIGGIVLAKHAFK
jgi:hypothetical protein